MINEYPTSRHPAPSGQHVTLTFSYREFMGTIAISPEAEAWAGTISREDIVLTSQHISLDELVDGLQGAVDFYLDENQ